MTSLRTITPFIAVAALAAACAGPSTEPSPDLFVDLFIDATREAGLDGFRHERGAAGDHWMPETYGAGVAFVDYDGDGWADVAAVGGGVWAAPAEGPAAITLYRNLGDGRFRDVTKETGLDRYRAIGFGIAGADMDNDGDLDLYLTALGPNLLLRNDDGVFVDVAAEAGVAGDAWSTAALFFDANRDGLVDLYVGQYVDWTPETDRWCTSDGVNKDYCMPHAYEGVGARFYLNAGDSRFIDRTREAGMDDNPGKTLGAAEYDLNADGWPDVVVANDTRRNLVYLNRKDGTFEEVGIRSGVAYDDNGRARAGMGLDIGVLDGTGKPSIVIGNFSEEMVGVYREVGGGIYRDLAPASGIGMASKQVLTFGVLLADVDLDADLDVLLANGHILEQVAEMQDGMTYRQPAQLFMNQGDGRFELAGADRARVLAEPLVARGAAYADYDRDGDLDVLLTENGGPLHLWRNQTDPATGADAHALRLYLAGRRSPRDALGARVVAVANGRMRQERRVRAGGSYLSQSETTLTLGLGPVDRLDTLRIHWPSGWVDTYEQLEAGRELRLTEGVREAEVLRIWATPGTPAPQERTESL
ncbi:MAG: CRTAC1 family protein [Rhodothermales bacterium]